MQTLDENYNFEINMKINAENCNLFYKKAYNETNNVRNNEHNVSYLFNWEKRKRLRFKSKKCASSFGSGSVIDNRLLIISLPKPFSPVVFAGSCESVFQNTPFAYWLFAELPCWENYVSVGTVHRNS